MSAIKAACPNCGHKIHLERHIRRGDWIDCPHCRALDALDVGRVDVRLGEDDRPYLLEINTLPGLNPVVSDLCIMAETGGLRYAGLINEILHLAAERYVQEPGADGRVRLFRRSSLAMHLPAREGL